MSVFRALFDQNCLRIQRKRSGGLCRLIQINIKGASIVSDHVFQHLQRPIGRFAIGVCICLLPMENRPVVQFGIFQRKIFKRSATNDLKNHKSISNCLHQGF